MEKTILWEKLYYGKTILWKKHYYGENYSMEKNYGTMPNTMEL